MRRLAPLALVLGVAVLAGTARADTFAVVPTDTFAVVPSTVAPAQFTASATAPNPPDSVALPFDLSTAPSTYAQLSYPELLGIWQRAGAAYGIPWQVLGSINKVESNFGRNMGPSSAGAIGWMQFMPDTWLRWGTDANGDGVADPWNPDDAIYSAARYLAAAGGATDLYRAVYAYNHADWYVQEVLGLANVYSSGGAIVASLDQLQQSLDTARAAVVAASDAVVAAKTTLRAETRIVSRWRARADRATLLSNRLILEQRAGEADAKRTATAAVVAARQQVLADAQSKLDGAKQQSAAAAFAPAAGQLLAAPMYSSGYVFPVGGGPGVVFASHTHHDYPAVDIAAPLGSPLYALANSVVVRSWSTPDSRCGIGFTLQAFDGQVWTYCHLSVLGPNIVPGVALSAGEEVGLVGDTGHATGPHLHLQLQPPLAWPQDEGWFASFAGTAFTWSDTGANDALDAPAVSDTPDSARTLANVAAPEFTRAPVFEVVAEPDPSSGVVFFRRAGS
jgi:murein DD-endopeptidase MepM/ murein hydrolase activator NlpD